MAGAVYLADTSVYVLAGRNKAVHERFTALLTEGRLATCQMTSAGLANEVNVPLLSSDEVNGPFTSRHPGPAAYDGRPGYPASPA